MQIKDFSSNPSTIEDFAIDSSQNEGVILNKVSTSQIAAQISSQSEQQDLTLFDNLSTSLQNRQGRSDFLMQQFLDREFSSFVQDNVYEILTDEGLTDEEKMSAINGGEETFTTDNLARSVYAEDVDITEPEESFQSRSLLLEVIPEVNEQKRYIQSLINGYRLSKEPTIGQLVADFGELVVPFAEWIQIDQLAREFDVSYDEAALMGSQKEALFNLIQGVSFSDRIAFTEKVLETISNNDTVIFSDGNYLSSIDTLERMVLNNDYSEGEKWFDNIVSVLDVIGVGVFGRILTRAGDVSKTADELNAIARSTHTDVNPASPSQIAKETSPNAARGSHTAAAEDTTGRAAEALYGTNRDEALANDLLPEPNIDNTVPNKVFLDGPQYQEPAQIKQIRERDGNSYLTGREAVRVRERIVESLENVEGMVPHRESLTIRLNDDGSTTFSMMYRPVDSGFSTANRAIENALYAFRNYGLSEQDLKLYRRVGDKYEPTNAKELAGLKALREGFTRRKKAIPPNLKEIDYAVGIDFQHRFGPQDLDIYDRLVVRNNLPDRLDPFFAKAKQGSFLQHVLDPNSYLPQRVVEPASALVDRAFSLRKSFVDMFKDDFISPFNKLSKNERRLVDEYIKEANLKSIPLDVVSLRAKGYSTEAINVLKAWRRSNDALWHSSNADLAVTLRNRGFQVFQDGNDTQLIVRPIGRNQINEGTTFYNSAENTFETMSKQELDEFYESGGTFARTSEPLEFENGFIDIVKVVDTPQGGYIRRIRDDEKVLAYRQGYYPVMYDANWFLTKVVRGSDGKEFRKTIASSKSESDILHTQKQLEATDPDGVYGVKRDRRSNQQRYAQMSENGWDIAVSSGMSNQKVRGQRLVDASSDLHKAGSSNLIDPLEAIAMQISQLSQRSVLRNYLDTVKTRWIDNYFDDIKLETNQFGEKYFPQSLDELTRKAGVNRKTIADARSIFNYIHHLENGYMNVIDEGFMATFNYMAEVLDDLNFKGAADLASGASKSSPTSVSKGAAFKLYLAANPQRQLIIQAHQNVQLAAINPRYMAGPLQRDFYRLMKVQRGDTSDTEAVKMFDEIIKSGILEAVDANNLIRQDVLKLAERTNLQRVGAAANKPLEIAQKWGFDVGEQSVLVLSWLAHRDLKIAEKGSRLTRRDWDEIAGKSRAFTFNMNRAGDMPYNQNSLAIIAQFLQVPHKAILQPLTNRALTPIQRGKLLAFNTMMYGVPPGLLGYLGMKPGPERDALEDGLVDALLNTTLSWATGEETQIDFGDLAPVNAYGLYDFVTTMATTDITTLLKESPSGSLLFGGNARIQQAFKTGARYFGVIDDYEDPELETKFSDVALASLNLFSGFSNAFKARYAEQMDQKISSLGNITDTDISRAEAAAQFFGFRTKTEVGAQEIRQELYSGQTFNESDVIAWYNDLKRHLARRGITVQERDMQQRVLAEAWRVFELDELKARQTLSRLLREDVEQGSVTIYEDILRQMGIKSNREVYNMISRLPESQERSVLLESMERLERAQEEAQEIQDLIDERN